MKDTMIGVDLAKSVFQLHVASMAGHLKFRKKVTRVQFRHFMAKHEPAVVVLEWQRELLGARNGQAWPRGPVDRAAICPTFREAAEKRCC